MGELVRKFIANSVKIYVCNSCNFHLAKTTDIISKGHSGPAYLFHETFNITIDSEEQDKYLTTGRHFIKNIRCIGCRISIGWTYVKAFDQQQKYKEGKFIIERAFITEVDNTEVNIPSELLVNHNLITKLNYYHQI